jgi:hypothetical protein
LFSIVTLTSGLILKQESEAINPFMILGIGFLIISLFMGLLMLNYWKSYNRKVKLVAVKFENLKSNFIFELTDDSVKYWDYEKHIDFKWSVFTLYDL